MIFALLLVNFCHERGTVVVMRLNSTKPPNSDTVWLNKTFDSYALDLWLKFVVSFLQISASTSWEYMYDVLTAWKFYVILKSQFSVAVTVTNANAMPVDSSCSYKHIHTSQFSVAVTVTTANAMPLDFSCSYKHIHWSQFSVAVAVTNANASGNAFAVTAITAVTENLRSCSE